MLLRQANLLAVILVVGVVAWVGGAVVPEPKGADRGRLSPEEIERRTAAAVAAWQKAGAEFGWIAINEVGGGPRWQPDREDVEDLPREGSPFQRDNPAAGYYAAVRFSKFPTGKLRSLPGPELCRRLWLDGSGVTDADLAEVARLTQLEWLALYRSPVSDAGMKHLAGLKHLRRLGLHDTRVADAGMKEVAKLTGLQILGVGSTKVTDAGLRELGVLKQLTLLDLSNTGVTDAGMKTLIGFQEMETLYLGGTAVTDAGAAQLAGLPRLRNLAR